MRRATELKTRTIALVYLQASSDAKAVDEVREAIKQRAAVPIVLISSFRIWT